MSDVATRPRLSIIVATWNAARTLERCLASIEQQTFTAWELLIADGASTDGTLDLIEQHADHIAWWDSRRDKGIYDAWNHAIPHAKGEYICFLGADDAWVDEHALETLFSRIGGEQYDLVTSRGRIERASPGKDLEFGAAWNFKRIGRYSVVCHPGMLHRRGLFDEHGLFDIQYRIAGDLDFLLRLPKDIGTLHVDQVTVLIEDAGVSRKNVLARLREQRMVLSRCDRFGPLRARIVWLDKLWRYPVARLLGLSH